MATDPYKDAKRALEATVDDIDRAIHRWRVAANGQSEESVQQAQQAALKIVGELRENLRIVTYTIDAATKDRERYAHISYEELAARQTFVKNMEARLQEFTKAMTQRPTAPAAAAAAPKKRAAPVKTLEDRIEEEGVRANQEFIDQQLALQQREMENQDAQLDGVLTGIKGLKRAAKEIHDEIEAQNYAIDELGREVGRAETRITMLRSKVDKLLANNGRGKFCCIFVLIVVLLLTMFLYFFI